MSGESKLASVEASGKAEAGSLEVRGATALKGATVITAPTTITVGDEPNLRALTLRGGSSSDENDSRGALQARAGGGRAGAVQRWAEPDYSPACSPAHLLPPWPPPRPPQVTGDTDLTSSFTLLGNTAVTGQNW